MTEQQKLDLLRQVLTAIGSILTGLGFFGAEMVGQWINTIMQIAGPLLMIIGIVWGFISNRASAVITQVANMDEVKSVQLVPQAGASALSAVTPHNVQVAPSSAPVSSKPA